MGRACSSHREDEKRIQIFFGKPEGKRRDHFGGGAKSKWNNNFKISNREGVSVDWSQVPQNLA